MDNVGTTEYDVLAESSQLKLELAEARAKLAAWEPVVRIGIEIANDRQRFVMLGPMALGPLMRAASMIPAEYIPAEPGRCCLTCEHLCSYSGKCLNYDGCGFHKPGPNGACDKWKRRVGQ